MISSVCFDEKNPFVKTNDHFVIRTSDDRIIFEDLIPFQSSPWYRIHAYLTANDIKIKKMELYYYGIHLIVPENQDAYFFSRRVRTYLLPSRSVISYEKGIGYLGPGADKLIIKWATRNKEFYIEEKNIKDLKKRWEDPAIFWNKDPALYFPDYSEYFSRCIQSIDRTVSSC